MENPEVFSSTYDANGNAYSFNDLDQLASNSNILGVEHDPNTSLEKVVLSDGPFEFSNQSYINDTVKDYIQQETRALNNQNFPVTVSNSMKFDMQVDLKNDYFLFPASMQLTCQFQLYVKTSTGRRAIRAYDKLCPLDGLMPVKNIMPCLDDQCTIPNHKTIDQRSLSRIMTILSETVNVEAAERRIRFSRNYFEGETKARNAAGTTGSHKWPATKSGQIELHPLDSIPKTASRQNTELAHAITDEFWCHLDLSKTPPFNNAVIYSRPCSKVSFTLDFGTFSEWLRIVEPDGTKPKDYTTPIDHLQPNFSNLELDINGIHVSYTQFALHPELLNMYQKMTYNDKISNQSQQSVEIKKVANPLIQGNSSWSYTIQNVIVPERLFITFVCKDNRKAPNGNPMFYSNLGVTKLTFQLLSSTQNRYNQSRKTSFNTDGTNVVTTTAEYEKLSQKEKYKADLFVQDTILKPAQLAIGQPETGRNARHVYLINENSVYKGKNNSFFRKKKYFPHLLAHKIQIYSFVINRFYSII